jgi:hypothetical protein
MQYFKVLSLGTLRYLNEAPRYYHWKRPNIAINSYYYGIDYNTQVYERSTDTTHRKPNVETQRFWFAACALSRPLEQEKPSVLMSWRERAKDTHKWQRHWFAWKSVHRNSTRTKAVRSHLWGYPRPAHLVSMLRRLSALEAKMRWESYHPKWELAVEPKPRKRKNGLELSDQIEI